MAHLFIEMFVKMRHMTHNLDDVAPYFTLHLLPSLLIASQCFFTANRRKRQQTQLPIFYLEDLDTKNIVE